MYQLFVIMISPSCAIVESVDLFHYGGLTVNPNF